MPRPFPPALLAHLDGDATTLCRLFEIVHALWYRQGCGSTSEGAWQSVAELERIAAELDDAGCRWRAQLARGRTSLWSGNFTGAVRVLGHLVGDVASDCDAAAAPELEQVAVGGAAMPQKESPPPGATMRTQGWN